MTAHQVPTKRFTAEIRIRGRPSGIGSPTLGQEQDQRGRRGGDTGRGRGRPAGQVLIRVQGTAVTQGLRGPAKRGALPGDNILFGPLKADRYCRMERADRLIGRDGEVARLRAAIASARSGSGGVALVAGLLSPVPRAARAWFAYEVIRDAVASQNRSEPASRPRRVPAPCIRRT